MSAFGNDFTIGLRTTFGNDFDFTPFAPVVATGGSLVDVEQSIAVFASGTLLTVEQEIIERISVSGALINVEQAIKQEASGSLINIEQRIKDATPTVLTNEDRYGWDLLVTIDGAAVDNGEIFGTLSITRRESSAALLDITLIKGAGVQDLYFYHGKSITVDLILPASIGRIYTGIIDIPEVDLINGLITLRCTDKRKEQINAQFGLSVAGIGKWSDHIFDTPVDVADELTQRLKTTTTAVDFDAFGNYTISDLMPKSSVDITITDSGVFRRKPSVQVASRARLTNRVNVEFTYQYVRLRHRELTFKLIPPTFCQVIASNGIYKFMRSDAIPAIQESTSFKSKSGSLVVSYLPEAGWKTCRTPTGDLTFIWSPQQTSGTTQPILDSAGNQVTDASGNVQYESVNRTVVDYTKAFSTGATWTGAKDFAQNIQEKINVEINAPQSQGLFGVIEKDQKNGKRIEFDTSEFEKNDLFVSPVDMISDGSDHYRDATGGAQEYVNALDVAVDMARTTIRRSHRANIVTFETEVRSDIDLKHTVRVNAGLIDATGKVVDIKHTFNMSTRDASSAFTLALTQSDNSPPTDSLSIPILNAPLVGDTAAKTINIYTNEAARHGNSRLTAVYGQDNTTFSTPAIDDISRDEQIVESDYSLDVVLDNDNLTITFE